jgi:hypothetical protein
MFGVELYYGILSNLHIDLYCTSVTDTVCPVCVCVMHFAQRTPSNLLPDVMSVRLFAWSSATTTGWIS